MQVLAMMSENGKHYSISLEPGTVSDGGDIDCWIDIQVSTYGEINQHDFYFRGVINGKVIWEYDGHDTPLDVRNAIDKLLKNKAFI